MNVVIELTGEAILRTVQGKPLLVPISGNFAATGFTIELNDSGKALWEHIANSRTCTVRELGDLLRSLYGIDIETAQRDVMTFLSDLDETGLVATVDAK
jgi:hypothetical protein